MSRDSCKTWLKREIGFEGCDIGHFLHGAFGKSLGMVIFKTPLLLYWTSMWMYRLIKFYIISPAEKLEVNENYTRYREYSDYMTNWGGIVSPRYTCIPLLVLFDTSCLLW